MSDPLPVWCVMPVLAGPEMTEAAIGDLLSQSVPTKILLVNQGVDDDFRSHLEELAEHEPRLLIWHHQPPLPSLSATWNTALRFVWAQEDHEVAFVVNNDVRLHSDTVLVLRSELRRKSALFVSAVGVTAEQFDALGALRFSEETSHGGPDFSCFLISKECHERYPFDEHFIPAFCEDLDYHRRLMLDGEGKRIFSVNLPYLHLASQTLKQVDEEQAAKIRQSIEQHSRAYYALKWGGPVNAETFLTPFGKGQGNPLALSYFNDPTTPGLQRRVMGDGKDSRPAEVERPAAPTD